jgi:hypothetical protein
MHNVPDEFAAFVGKCGGTVIVTCDHKVPLGPETMTWEIFGTLFTVRQAVLREATREEFLRAQWPGQTAPEPHRYFYEIGFD